MEESQFGRHGIPSANDIWSYGIQILANSEISQVKRQFIRKYKMLDWYFFYHGFAALDWFRDFKYFSINPNPSFSHLFISYNHLVTAKRSYRLFLLANLLNKNLDRVGLISAPAVNDRKIWFNELYSNRPSQLNADAKKLIYTEFNKLDKGFILDKTEVCGLLSTNINLELNAKAFLQVVTETVFFDKKLHLTEKIFKPIVSRQPFMLVAAPGNLAYLKSYGFKTFSDWWDESYDNEEDDNKRISMITEELEKLSKLSMSQLRDMHREMSDVLDYNREHFYNNFKKHIVHELVDNFEKCINIHNFDLSERFRIPLNLLDLPAIKKRLLQ